jgi:TRAP-type mannitol/chloroaromatic compound transport system permease small subunit
MQGFLAFSHGIDRILGFLGKLGAWCGLFLVCVVCVDVVTRYFGVPKPFGWNSTQFQEFEYWMHTFLFALMIGWAYTRQTHVRIDLISDYFPRKVKLIIEIIGCAFFLFGFAALGAWYTGKYAWTSFIADETSKSVLGLPNVWILKSVLFLMFVLMCFAAVSQFIKSVAALKGTMFRGALVDPLKENN